MTDPVLDQHRRPLRNLRISVTDRCNLRCGYCMPEPEYVWLSRSDILTFEEIGVLVDAFGELGVDRIRLTGGEPLIRTDLAQLVTMLSSRPWLSDLAMTTNGLLLADHAEALKAAGLRRLTVSLDSVDPARYARLAGRDEHARAVAAIRFAAGVGFESIKLNTVVMRGENDEEIPALLEFAREVGAELRFIEYMDVGGATAWSGKLVVSREEILARVAERFGPVAAVGAPTSAPARRFELENGQVFGIVASTTAPFCGTCDRGRLTADGTFYQCLYAREGLDLRGPLRDGIGAGELVALLRSSWTARSDRGAEARVQLTERSALADKRELDEDPRLEMHTRGG